MRLRDRVTTPLSSNASTYEHGGNCGQQQWANEMPPRRCALRRRPLRFAEPSHGIGKYRVSPGAEGHAGE
jgi:hypothetical protein